MFNMHSHMFTVGIWMEMYVCVRELIWKLIKERNAEGKHNINNTQQPNRHSFFREKTARVDNKQPQIIGSL